MKDDPGIKRPVSENAEPGDEDPRDLSYSVVGAAIEVHNAIGPGFDAETYKHAVAQELKLRDLPARLDVSVPVMFKGVEVSRQRLDCVVDDQLVLEFRADERLGPECKARAMLYLRGIELEQGVLLNFGGSRLEFVRVPHQRRRKDEE